MNFENDYFLCYQHALLKSTCTIKKRFAEMEKKLKSFAAL